MLIKEYRIPLPLSVEEYRIAQLYMIAVSKICLLCLRVTIYTQTGSLRRVYARRYKIQSSKYADRFPPAAHMFFGSTVMFVSIDHLYVLLYVGKMGSSYSQLP